MNQNPKRNPNRFQPQQLPKQQFNQQPWQQRFKKLGDEAEKVFETVYDQNGWPYVRSGLDRPPLDMSKLEKMVCYTPDYLTNDGYVEVQGFGKDRIFKLKDDKLDALVQWDTWVMTTQMFVWDNVGVRWAIFPISQFKWMPPNVDGVYPEGKTWMGWTPDYLMVDWKPYGTV